MYIPGPLLKPCNNEIVMLELGVATKADAAPTGAPHLFFSFAFS